MSELITLGDIQDRIFKIRGQSVMLDRDLAALYGMRTIALRQQVRRNMDHFPEDFAFQLSPAEAALLVSQRVIPSGRSLGGYLPIVFTEEGVSMLSSVLRSPVALKVIIAIMRAFVKLRHAALRDMCVSTPLRWKTRFFIRDYFPAKWRTVLKGVNRQLRVLRFRNSAQSSEKFSDL